MVYYIFQMYQEISPFADLRGLVFLGVYNYSSNVQFHLQQYLSINKNRLLQFSSSYQGPTFSFSLPYYDKEDTWAAPKNHTTERVRVPVIFLLLPGL